MVFCSSNLDSLNFVTAFNELTLVLNMGADRHHALFCKFRLDQVTHRVVFTCSGGWWPWKIGASVCVWLCLSMSMLCFGSSNYWEAEYGTPVAGLMSHITKLLMRFRRLSCYHVSTVLPLLNTLSVKSPKSSNFGKIVTLSWLGKVTPCKYTDSFTVKNVHGRVGKIAEE